MAKQVKKNPVGHFTKVFGNASGYKVLKEIRDYAEYPDIESVQIMHGRRQMLQYILDRIKSTAGKREVYADIIYNVEML